MGVLTLMTLILHLHVCSSSSHEQDRKRQFRAKLMSKLKSRRRELEAENELRRIGKLCLMACLATLLTHFAEPNRLSRHRAKFKYVWLKALVYEIQITFTAMRCHAKASSEHAVRQQMTKCHRLLFHKSGMPM